MQRYDDCMKDARSCNDYDKCLLCHGCRNFSASIMKCQRCSMNPQMICKHNHTDLVKAFKVVYKNTRPEIMLPKEVKP